MDAIKKGFGKNLKEIRKLHHLTQEKLSEQIGINLRQLARIEAGESFVTSETILQICKSLNISPRKLFEFEIEEIKTGTDNIIHYNIINSQEFISSAQKENKLSFEDKTRENNILDMLNRVDVNMQIAAKNKNDSVTVEEYYDNEVVIIKTYYPNGDVRAERVDRKSDYIKELEHLKGNINKISNDIRKIKFLNLAIKSLNNAEAMQELRSFLDGVEMMRTE